MFLLRLYIISFAARALHVFIPKIHSVMESGRAGHHLIVLCNLQVGLDTSTIVARFKPALVFRRACTV